MHLFLTKYNFLFFIEINIQLLNVYFYFKNLFILQYTRKNKAEELRGINEKTFFK